MTDLLHLNRRPAMISLCDVTGVMAEPWAEAGYDCYCVDVQHSIRRDRTVAFGNGGGRINFVWGDARSWMPPEGLDIRFVAAFPPCTHVAGSGARDWKKKGQYMLTDALQLFTACQAHGAWSGAPYMVENPSGALSNHMGSHDYTFHPAHYAGYLDDPSPEAYSKLTCLWTGNGFVMPDRKEVPAVLGSKMHLMAPSDDRADKRSATPRGFARAVFLANHRDDVRLAA